MERAVSDALVSVLLQRLRRAGSAALRAGRFVRIGVLFAELVLDADLERRRRGDVVAVAHVALRLGRDGGVIDAECAPCDVRKVVIAVCARNADGLPARVSDIERQLGNCGVERLFIRALRRFGVRQRNGTVIINKVRARDLILLGRLRIFRILRSGIGRRTRKQAQ